MRFLEHFEESTHDVWSAEGQRHGGIQLPAQLPEELEMHGREQECFHFCLFFRISRGGRDESHPMEE